MPKILKNTLKAEQNRNRVSLHRAWKSINQRNAVPSQPSNSNTSQTPINGNNLQSAHFREALRRWALNFNISKRAVNGLLQLLISFGLNSLPSDSRSLLATPRSVELKSISNGKIW